MKKLNVLTEPKLPAKAAQYRYWFSPPVTVTVRASDLEAAIPQTQRLKAFDPDQTVDLPADEIFKRNVPTISLQVLSGLLPDHVAPSEGLIVLPAARLATAYALVEQAEIINKEELCESEPTGPIEPDAPAEPESEEPLVPVLKQNGLFSGLPMFRRRLVQEADTLSQLPTAERNAAGLDEPSEQAPEVAADPRVADEIVPLPLAPEPNTPPAAVDPEPEKSSLPIATEEGLQRLDAQPTEEPVPLGPMLTATEEKILAGENAEIPPKAPKKGKEAVDAPPPPPQAPQMLADQEPLQSLFLTEETLTVGRVVVLCSELPGISSCILAHGSFIVASHNVPENVDLVSMSSHAEEMLQDVRKVSARMGVGSAQAVTLHSEKGVISFFHRNERTLLVFHKDRGFIPGVREKLATVLAELSKSPITLAVGRGDGHLEE